MENQDYSNHTRWNKLYHFVLAPLLLINLIFSIVRMVQDPGVDRGAYIVMSLVFVLMLLSFRLHTLRVQDRLIRLEERLRLEKLLSPELAEKATGLRVSQLIAIRFASDGELEELVGKIVEGELTEPKEIKLAIKEWRADFLRA